MSTVKQEERGVSAALGQIPKVNNNRALSCTVSIAGTGLGDISIQDISNAVISQHLITFPEGNFDQLYVHRVRAYGTAGGYLSMAPYPHRFNYVPPGEGTSGTGQTWNAYESTTSTANTYRKGSLMQQYEFGINGATRPELHFEWPTAEVVNNPFIVYAQRIDNDSGSGTTGVNFTNDCKMLTLQSTNVNGDALYIIQFDVTIRNSDFIEIVPALGAAAFGEKNVVRDNYKPPLTLELKTEEGKKAEELANKKRKIQNVKDLTMPTLNSH